MGKRTQYTKYHEKLKRIVKQCTENNSVFIDDEQFAKYGEYFLKTIKKEITFPLYRYCGLRYKDDFSLDLENLKCSCNGRLNDIFEGLPQVDSSENNMEEYLVAIEKHAYLKCFSETPNNNLMWAHYADSYKGICIEYDICKLKDANIAKAIFPVYYTKDRNYILATEYISDYYRGIDNGLKTEQIIGDTKGIFLQKAYYWNYEREWRYCEVNPDINSGKTKDIAFPCVSAVYIGPRVLDEDRSKLMQHIKEYEDKHKCFIKVFKTNINNTSFELEHKLIKTTSKEN